MPDFSDYFREHMALNQPSCPPLASSFGHLKVADCLRKWPWTMAIIALKEDLAVYHLLDAWTLIDLWQYLGTQ